MSEEPTVKPPSSGASGTIHSISHSLLITDPISLSLDLYNVREKLADATEEEISDIITKQFKAHSDNCRIVLDLGDIHFSDYKVTVRPLNYHSKWKRDMSSE